MDKQGMSGKLVVITGATSGIGRATAEGLSAMGATLLLVGRDEGRLKAAQDSMPRVEGVPMPETHCADLSSMAEVRRLAAAIRDAHPRVDVLINNAGTIAGRRKLTVDGYEYTFALDHLSPFLLTNLLLDRLKAAAPSRIITVSSSAHLAGKIHFDDLMLARRYSAPRAYGQAKLANVLFTYELARRLEGTRVTANCVHPGAVRTHFGNEASGPVRIGLVAVRPFELSARQGARTPIYLASSPEVEGVTGRYFVRGKARRSSTASYDLDAARRLWEESARLTGLEADERAAGDRK
ncbi:MAG: SDR family oxidoreductase [Methanomassiliicoccus sp.]|nr:SDR family oxidoreductase [Methanomassiliicoccus sp.]